MNRFKPIKKWQAILLILALLIFLFRYELVSYVRDFQMDHFFWLKERWKPYVDQNPVTLLRHIPTRVCIVTLETRDDGYAALHDQNVAQYIAARHAAGVTAEAAGTGAPAYSYTYKRVRACAVDRYPHTHNVYWCKFFLVRDLLDDPAFDYVVWMDSDTVFADRTIDLARLMRSYESHFFAGLDHFSLNGSETPAGYDYLNSGVFAVRNSAVGKKILRLITERYNMAEFQRRCVRSVSGSLNGRWGRSCYEQGVMNDVLYRDFLRYVTVWSNRYIHNGHLCAGDFIVHLMRASGADRIACFRQFVDTNPTG